MPEKIQQDVEKLEELVTEEDHKQSLERLSKAAHSGASLKWWFNRLLFGFNLADAVEQWLNAFDPKVGKPIKEQIPKLETREVVAAWMKFSMRRSIIMFLLSTAITLITAFFLWKQIQTQNDLVEEQKTLTAKQDELIGIQKEKNSLEERFLYTQILYDVICKEPDERYSQVIKEDCKPKYNYRQRTDALINLLKTEKDVSGARLDGIDFSFIDLKGAKLKRAYLNDTYLNGMDLSQLDFSGADMSDADLGYSVFQYSNFKKTKLSNAELKYARMRSATLYDAELNNASLSGAILIFAKLDRASLVGADLRNVDLRGASLLRTDLRDIDLNGAKYSKSTKFPKNFDPKEHGMILSNDIK